MRITKVTVGKDRKLNVQYNSDGLSVMLSADLESDDKLNDVFNALALQCDVWLDEHEGLLPVEWVSTVRKKTRGSPQNVPGVPEAPKTPSETQKSQDAPKANGSALAGKQQIQPDTPVQPWQLEQLNKALAQGAATHQYVVEGLNEFGCKSIEQLRYCEAAIILTRIGDELRADEEER